MGLSSSSIIPIIKYKLNKPEK